MTTTDHLAAKLQPTPSVVAPLGSEFAAANHPPTSIRVALPRQARPVTKTLPIPIVAAPLGASFPAAKRQSTPRIETLLVSLPRAMAASLPKATTLGASVRPPTKIGSTPTGVALAAPNLPRAMKHAPSKSGPLGASILLPTTGFLTPRLAPSAAGPHERRPS